MTLRFNRDYKLVILKDSKEIIITPPFRIVFDASKSVSGGLNKLNLKIYNLIEATRLSLVKDKDDNTYIQLKLFIGYDGKLEQVFQGSIFRAQNIREGAEFYNSIECQDGGVDYLNSFTSKTIKGAGVIDSLLKDMPNTSKGKIADIQELIRPKVLVGNTTKLLDEIVDNETTWFIDNEQLYLIKNNQVVSSLIPIVDATTGLLNTPENDLKKVTFSTILNPSIRPGGQCQLISRTAPHLNGNYKVETIIYKGDNYGNDWTQTISGYLLANKEVLK